ncbi:MAG: hypothetical protein CW338_02275 [Clostridiales bacterium]|nr:hypothetical protein [Clostridiales bacterium]
MKKLLSLVLALVMLLSVCSVAAADSALPAVGDVACGFEVKSISRLEMLGADVIMYEHQKTGALVMQIANDDLNRVFDITFRTPTLDNRGIPHVFEHATLDGSAKYPSAALFFNLGYQTYNTYMNASTYNFMTTFPVASLSEAQLLMYADYYTDSCFNPVIYENESIFREEAWRYAMTTPEDDLTIAGTVYSEMKGSYTLASAASFNFTGTIFPGSNSANVHGGKPSDIPSMTWDDLKVYHDTYYHPSNSLTFLYGDFENVNAFLQLLDGYFSAYERKEFNLEDSNYTPITAPVEATYTYGYAAGSDTDHAGIVYYGFVCEGVDEEKMNQLDMLTTLMGADFSPFTQRMKDELPAASTACYIEIDGPEVMIYFCANGVNEDEVPLFKQIVDESIAQVAEEGFSAEDTDAIISSYKLSILLATESSSVGVDTIPNIAYYWASTGNVFGYSDYIDSIDNFAALNNDGTFKALTAEYLIGNQRTALALTVPVAGLKDEEDAALAQELAQIKAAMSEEEIGAIVAATNAEDPAEDASAYVRALTAVSVDSLPEDIRIFDITESVNADGLRCVNVDANTAGIGQAAILLDAQGLEQDQLHYFKLYVDVIGDLNTASHNRQQLSSLMTRYLYNGVIRVSAMEEGDGCHPYLRAGFIALDEDMQAGYDLMYELLFESDFTDVEALKGSVAYLKNYVKQTINSSAYQIILYRAMGDASATSRYFNYMSYVDYYNFLCDTEQLLESDPDTVVANLLAVQNYFNNSTNAVSGFVGNAESAANHRAVADSFFAKLGEHDVIPAEYVFPSVEAPEGLIIDGAVQYNLVFASYEDMGMEGYTAELDAVTALVSDAFLYPMLRDQYGAYGVLHGADTDSGVYIISYRDPNITETFAVYGALPELIASLDDLDQETLDGYIMSSYSGYAMSSGELTDGFSAFLNYMSGTPQEDRITYMKQLKAVTPDAVRACSDMYRKLYENGTFITAGSAAAINANADLYASIINPFGVVDNSNATFDDLIEGEWYYDAARYCMINAFVYPASETHFGIEDQITLGDLAVIMYMAIGGDYSPDDAIAFLAQYGILPMEDASTPLTREEMTVYSYFFCAAMGIPVEDVPMDGFTDTAEVSEGCEGMIGCMLAYELVTPAGEDVFAPQAPATFADLCWFGYVLLAE